MKYDTNGKANLLKDLCLVVLNSAILQGFYWPTIYRDVAEYCGSCGSCQIVAQHHIQPAPLVSLPIMDTSFKKVVMDIVEPLSPSQSVTETIHSLTERGRLLHHRESMPRHKTLNCSTQGVYLLCPRLVEST